MSDVPPAIHDTLHGAAALFAVPPRDLGHAPFHPVTLVPVFPLQGTGHKGSLRGRYVWPWIHYTHG